MRDGDFGKEAVKWCHRYPHVTGAAAVLRKAVEERAPVLMQSGNGKARIKFGLMQSRVLTALILFPPSWVWEKGHDSLWPVPITLAIQISGTQICQAKEKYRLLENCKQ